jgi:hypothetical protein
MVRIKKEKCYSGCDCENTQFMSLLEGTHSKDLLHFSLVSI